MKRTAFPFILVVFLASVVSSWGDTIVVNSTSDSGTGSLREAIGSALPGDSITFDPSVFPPTSPDTIALASRLPVLLQGNLVIDASDAGVVINGSRITTPELVHGLSISSSQHLNGKKRNGKKIGGSFRRIRKIIHKNANSKNWPYKDKRILLALDLLRDKNITRRRAANILDSIVDTSFNSE